MHLKRSVTLIPKKSQIWDLGKLETVFSKWAARKHWKIVAWIDIQLSPFRIICLKLFCLTKLTIFYSNKTTRQGTVMLGKHINNLNFYFYFNLELASQPASNPFRMNNGKANSKRGTEYFDNLQSSKLKTGWISCCCFLHSFVLDFSIYDFYGKNLRMNCLV